MSSFNASGEIRRSRNGDEAAMSMGVAPSGSTAKHTSLVIG